MTPTQLLDFERQHPHATPDKHARIRHEHGISEIRYYVLLERAATSNASRSEPPSELAEPLPDATRRYFRGALTASKMASIACAKLASDLLFIVPPTGVEPATYGTGNRGMDTRGLTFPKSGG